MNKDSEFVRDWLAAYIKHLDLKEVDLMSHQFVEDRSLGTGTHVVFYTGSRKSWQKIRLHSVRPISKACVLRGMIEACESQNVKHDATDDVIRNVLGIGPPREMLEAVT